jgi:hypothetical protein
VYSGTSNADKRGVGILINKDIRGALLEWDPVSDRIITARIQTKLRKISIVNVTPQQRMPNLLKRKLSTAFWIKPY